MDDEFGNFDSPDPLERFNAHQRAKGRSPLSDVDIVKKRESESPRAGTAAANDPSNRRGNEMGESMQERGVERTGDQSSTQNPQPGSPQGGDGRTSDAGHQNDRPDDAGAHGPQGSGGDESVPRTDAGGFQNDK